MNYLLGPHTKIPVVHTLWLEMADFREILKIQIENFRSEDSTAFFTS
jgi:hypothetical protein